MPDATSQMADDWLAARSGLLSRLRGDRHSFDDDWWKKTGRAQSSGYASRHGAFGQAGGNGRSEAQADTRRRFERLAGGAQPAVTKVLAFGSGAEAPRAASYISRNGSILLENEIGMDLFGRQVAAEATKEWAPLFSGGEKSLDLAMFQASFIAGNSGPKAVEASLSALHHAFDGRSFAVAVWRAGGETRIEGVAVLNLPTQGRLEIDDKGRARIEERLLEALGGDFRRISFQFGRHGHGVRFAGSQLRGLVEKHSGQVFNEQGVVIENARDANRLAQRDWRPKLESRAPRDHMHLLISAPGEAEKESFKAAVRQFLLQEFGGHKYLFAIHDPVDDPKKQMDGGKRPHLHAHALIATRSNYGDRLNVWVTDLNQWRASFSKCARDHGMAIEVTHRHETLQAPAYRYKDVRPVSFIGRTEHIGTSAAAQRRYDAKRSENPHADRSLWAQNQVQLARRIWQEIADQSATARGQAFAEDMLARFDGIARDASPGRIQSVSADPTRQAHDRSVEPLGSGQGIERDGIRQPAPPQHGGYRMSENEGAGRQREQAAQTNSSHKEHVDLSQLSRHPPPDPSIEKMEQAILAGQEHARDEAEDRRITKQADRSAGGSRGERGRDDDRRYDR